MMIILQLTTIQKKKYNKKNDCNNVENDAKENEGRGNNNHRQDKDIIKTQRTTKNDKKESLFDECEDDILSDCAVAAKKMAEVDFTTILDQCEKKSTKAITTTAVIQQQHNNDNDDYDLKKTKKNDENDSELMLQQDEEEKGMDIHNTINNNNNDYVSDRAVSQSTVEVDFTKILDQYEEKSKSIPTTTKSPSASSTTNEMKKRTSNAGVTTNPTINDDTLNHNDDSSKQQQTIMKSNNDYEETTIASFTSTTKSITQASTLLQQIVNTNERNKNDFFLKSFIMLASFSCLPPSLSSSNQEDECSLFKKEITKLKREYSNVEQKLALIAADSVLNLLIKAGNSLAFLVSLLPKSSSSSSFTTTDTTPAASTTATQQDGNNKIDSSRSSNVENDIEFYNNNATFTTMKTSSDATISGLYENDGGGGDDEYEMVHIVPDLLPPCTSLNGDATTTFFRACLTPSTTTTTLLESKFENGHGNNDKVTKPQTSSFQCQQSLAISTTAPTPPPSPATTTSSSSTTATITTTSRINVALSSVLSSVKTNSVHVVGGRGSGGPSSALGVVFHKVRSRRGRNRSAANNTKEGDGEEVGGNDVDNNINDNGPSLPNRSNSERSRYKIESGSGSGSGGGASSSGVEYTVLITKEMLGLTVENVLERTVVRTVLANGAAKKAGAKVGSLIVRVGSVETTNLTHFETIDELRQSQRPLKLVLRRVGKDVLRGAREEMGRLIKGGGFGVAGVAGISPHSLKSNNNDPKSEKNNKKNKQKHSLEKDEFMVNLREQWIEGARRVVHLNALTKKDEYLVKAGVKLIWILSLLVIGLEREAIKLNVAVASSEMKKIKKDMRTDGDDKFEGRDEPFYSYRHNYSSKHLQQTHSEKDYFDAAKSVSKILHDYILKHFEREMSTGERGNGKKQKDPTAPERTPSRLGRKMNKLLAPPAHIKNQQRNAVPGASRRNSQQSGMAGGGVPVDSNPLVTSSPAETALLRIGDVLHRTRSFLADPFSKPAALLRGEVIALLCDILDMDVDMILSEDPLASSSSSSRGNIGEDNTGGGAINDLGSAGSLLKLVVLNCSMMRSPNCAKIVAAHNKSHRHVIASKPISIRDQQQLPNKYSHKAHAGNRFLAVVHRLAASRSTSARITACSLGPVLWGHLDFTHQLQLRGVITRALHDVEVVVRKSTASVLHEIAELVFDSRAVPWLVLMCERAMTDPEPQLRAAAITLTWHLAEHLPNAFYGNASEGSRFLRGLPPRSDPKFTEVYLLQCKLLPVATRLAEDRAASVRLAVAAQCDRLANALGEHWYSVIIDLLQALLSDEDENVRGEATLCIPRLAEACLLDMVNGEGFNMTVNVLESLLPVATKLLKDKSTDVRVSLATAAGELLTLLVRLEEIVGSDGQSATNTSISSEVGNLDRNVSESKGHKKHIDVTLIPLLQTLLHDTDPGVTSAALRAVTNASRGNVREIGASNRRKDQQLGVEDDSLSMSSHQSHMSKDPGFIPVLSEKQVLRLLPTLSNLATSAQWRVRQSAVEIVPALLGCTHNLETRSEIAQLCVKLMGDSVFAVRKTAAECLCIGGSSVGDRGTSRSREWLTAIVIPHIEACRSSSDCKQRLLSLKMVEIIVVNGTCCCVVDNPTETIKAVSTDSTILKTPVLEGGSELMASTSTSLRKILQIASSLSDDNIANVRLNVGRVFGNITNLLEEEDLDYVVAVLEEQLKTESIKPGGGDRDVHFYAKRAIRLSKDHLTECC